MTPAAFAEKYGLTYDPAMKARAYDFFGQRVLAETHVPQGVREMLEILRMNMLLFNILPLLLLQMK